MDEQNDFSKPFLEALNGRVNGLSSQERWDALVELVTRATKRALKRKEGNETAEENQVRHLLSSVDG